MDNVLALKEKEEKIRAEHGNEGELKEEFKIVDLENEVTKKSRANSQTDIKPQTPSNPLRYMLIFGSE